MGRGACFAPCIDAIDVDVVRVTSKSGKSSIDNRNAAALLSIEP